MRQPVLLPGAVSLAVGAGQGLGWHLQEATGPGQAWEPMRGRGPEGTTGRPAPRQPDPRQGSSCRGPEAGERQAPEVSRGGGAWGRVSRRSSCPRPWARSERDGVMEARPPPRELCQTPSAFLQGPTQREGRQGPWSQRPWALPGPPRPRFPPPSSRGRGRWEAATRCHRLQASEGRAWARSATDTRQLPDSATDPHNGSRGPPGKGEQAVGPGGGPANTWCSQSPPSSTCQQPGHPTKGAEPSQAHMGLWVEEAVARPGTWAAGTGT